jgi:hypothetical protein
VFGVGAGVDDAVHVNVEIVDFETGGVGTGGVEGYADGALTVDEVNAFFEDILDDFGILFGEPAVEGGNSHGQKEMKVVMMIVMECLA